VRGHGGKVDVDTWGKADAVKGMLWMKMTEGKSLRLRGLLGPTCSGSRSFLLETAGHKRGCSSRGFGVLGGRKSMHLHRREQPFHLSSWLCCLLERDVLRLFRERMRLGGAGRKAVVGGVV